MKTSKVVYKTFTYSHHIWEMGDLLILHNDDKIASVLRMKYTYEIEPIEEEEDDGWNYA